MEEYTDFIVIDERKATTDPAVQREMDYLLKQRMQQVKMDIEREMILNYIIETEGMKWHPTQASAQTLSERDT